MEVGYKKDLRHNYMIIEESSNNGSRTFCIRMLERQNIHGILPLEQKLLDNRTLLYYDITGKQAFINIIDKISLSCDRVKDLCLCIIRTIESAYEYLLPEDDFILTPELIYIDIATYSPNLCYLPGYGKCIKEQMNRLLEYLMNKVDYNDKDAVYLVYQLYAVSKEEGHTFEQLKEVLNPSEKNQRTMESRNKSDNVNQKEALFKKEVPVRKEASAREGVPGINDEPSAVNDEIPVIMEKVEGETEIDCYSIKTLVYTGACILAGILALALSFITKIICNNIGTRIDYSKLSALVLILLCAEGYLLNKLLDKKNKVTKIIKTHEYIDPREDYSYRAVQICQDGKTIQTAVPGKNTHYSNVEEHKEEDKEFEPTCLLNASIENTAVPFLKPLDESKYKTIPITSLPLFIGKLKKNVDFCLESDTVSRYHAKITKEGEEYFLTDLNSTNGTYVNKELLPTYQKREIKFEDELSFADIKYRFLQENDT